MLHCIACIVNNVQLWVTCALYVWEVMYRYVCGSMAAGVYTYMYVSWSWPAIYPSVGGCPCHVSLVVSCLLLVGKSTHSLSYWNPLYATYCTTSYMYMPWAYMHVHVHVIILFNMYYWCTCACTRIPSFRCEYDWLFKQLSAWPKPISHYRMTCMELHVHVHTCIYVVLHVHVPVLACSPVWFWIPQVIKSYRYKMWAY